MMAAQAAVLSATSATGVNLVKRAPNGDDDVEQSPMAGQSSSAPTPQLPLTKYEKEEIQRLCEELKSKRIALIHPAFDKDDEVEALKRFIEELEKRRKGKPQADRTSINAVLAIFETELAELNNQLSEMKADKKLYVDRYHDINQAIHENNFGYLREKYLNPQ
ncbi:hypothetical protein BASA83_009789 [Batrachochytrium salamandrivorans]|nr:hypothetical protein BASA83_009789 [Batrachochytrium salamandrivorans]